MNIYIILSISRFLENIVLSCMLITPKFKINKNLIMKSIMMISKIKNLKKTMTMTMTKKEKKVLMLKIKTIILFKFLNIE